MLRKLWITLAACLATSAYANIEIPIHLVTDTGIGKQIGTINVSESKFGLVLTPNLTDLTPGLHGFHIHQNPSCDDKAMAAGGHLDPQATKHHHGPYKDSGHLGDSPALFVDKDGHATLPVLAPRLTIDSIKNHSIMIHANGDNYSDNPENGGGGARIACGVIK